jgi:hypothetical protein
MVDTEKQENKSPNIKSSTGKRGRSKISSRNRNGSFSKRAMLGKLGIEDEEFKCEKCGHEKAFEFLGNHSPRFNAKKCCKCSYITGE